jgi:hypothetical protein
VDVSTCHRLGETVLSVSVAAANHEYRSVPITAAAESATNLRTRFDPKALKLAASTGLSSDDVSRAKNLPRTKERRLAASEFADQVAKSPWLRIQCVNQVFALALTK